MIHLFQFDVCNNFYWSFDFRFLVKIPETAARIVNERLEVYGSYYVGIESSKVVSGTGLNAFGLFLKS